VLIVEDDPTARRALRTLIASRGYRTDAVSCGEDALTHVTRGKMPGIALVDLDLPGMNGMELIRELAVISPLIFPILITAATREVVDAIFQNLPVMYFQKPINFDQLMTTLSDHQSDH
jgi:two-component system response regulator (stage 0 sporulation protein F)